MAALVTLIALVLFTSPATYRSTEIAASQPAATPGTEATVEAEGPTDTPDDGTPDDGILGDDSEDAGDSAPIAPTLDIVTDPKLLSAEATIQRQLSGHGWTVTVDGTMGAKTRRAIAEFQHANGLPPTGNVDTETGIRLGSPDANGYQHYLSNPLPPPAPPAPGTTRPDIDPMTRIEQLADSVGFDWRGRGVTFIIGCHEYLAYCSPGSYDTRTRQIYIKESTLADQALLRYVIFHELAHAWQFTVRGWPEAENDVSAWGRTGIDGLEAAADCLAAAWGIPRTHQWTCPADAQAHLLTLYQNS